MKRVEGDKSSATSASSHLQPVLPRPLPRPCRLEFTGLHAFDQRKAGLGAPVPVRRRLRCVRGFRLTRCVCDDRVQKSTKKITLMPKKCLCLNYYRYIKALSVTVSDAITHALDFVPPTAGSVLWTMTGSIFHVLCRPFSKCSC